MKEYKVIEGFLRSEDRGGSGLEELLNDFSTETGRWRLVSVVGTGARGYAFLEREA